MNREKRPGLWHSVNFETILSSWSRLSALPSSFVYHFLMNRNLPLQAPVKISVPDVLWRTVPISQTQLSSVVSDR